MENLTLLEKEALEILKQLERCCERVELHNPKYAEEEKNLDIMFNDLDFSVLKRSENIHDVEKYLQKYGVDFHITFDFEDDIPLTHIDREHPTEDFVELGVVKGKNILATQSRIKELIKELTSKGSIKRVEILTKPELKIQYKTKLGQFIFNDTVVELTGKQKDVADFLVGHEKETPVSWDEIYDQFKDSVTDQDIPNDAELDKRKRSVRTAVTEINNHAKIYLENKELISAKNNEYWIQYEVDKGR